MAVAVAMALALFQGKQRLRDPAAADPLPCQRGGEEQPQMGEILAGFMGTGWQERGQEGAQGKAKHVTSNPSRRHFHKSQLCKFVHSLCFLGLRAAVSQPPERRNQNERANRGCSLSLHPPGGSRSTRTTRSTTAWGWSDGGGTPRPTDLLFSALPPLRLGSTLQNYSSASCWTLTASPGLGAWLRCPSTPLPP